MSPKNSSAELCRFPIQHFNSVLTHTYPKNFPAELCRLPIQHFNSVLETYMFEKNFGRGLPITNSTLQQRFGAIYVQKNLRQSSADFQFNTSTVFWRHTCPKKSSAELCRFAIQHFNSVLTYTYPKKIPAELCRLPIQHFNSVLEPYMSKKIFGRTLPICNSTLQQVFDLYISYCQSSARVPITNSTLQQRLRAIYVQKNFRQSSADYQFNTSTALWRHTCSKKF